MADILCMGELLIDFVPGETGPLQSVGTFHKAAGGAPANVAVGLARLGVPAGFMGQVGEDPFGRFLATTLDSAGVDVAPLRFTPHAHTLLAFVSLADQGEREFLFYRPSADMLFGPDDVDEAAVAAAKTLHFGSIGLIGEPNRAATLHAIAIARRHGRQVSYDPNLRLALWPSPEDARAGLLLGLQHAEIVKIGEDEVRFLTGNPDVHAGARALWHDGLALMAVTLGPGGCLWLTPDSHGAVQGFKVAPVDTTGAGDAFMAGLLAGLHDRPGALSEPAALDAACRFANAMGALVTTRRGAIPAMPDRATVDAFIAGSGRA